MADKKLSDVTSVEDFDYFLGVKSNGDVQKMSKDSMKKVISELMSSFSERYGNWNNQYRRCI